MPQPMKLEQYIRAIGDDSAFFTNSGMSSHIMKTISRGEPIAESYAQKIVDKLSKEFGRPITINMVSDLKTC
jgi:hypothetical protein